MRKTIAYSGQASVPQSAETTLRAMYTSCVSGWASVARLVGDLAGRQGGVVQPRATVLRKRCDVTQNGPAAHRSCLRWPSNVRSRWAYRHI